MNNLITLSGKSGTGKDTVGKMMQILTDNPDFTDKAVVSFLDRPYQSQYQIKKFADKLKDMVCLLIGCTREELEDRVFKEKELDETWRVWSVWVSFEEGTNIFASKEEAEKFHSEVWDDTGTHIKSYLLTPRTLMQLLGTEAGREIIHPNIWVNALFSDYKQRFGYADGYYTCKCGKCGKNFTGDKRAVRCEDCSVFYPNWIITDVRFPNEVKAIKDRGGIIIRINTNNLHTDEHVSETLLDNYEFDFIIDNNDSLLDLVVKVRELLTKIN